MEKGPDRDALTAKLGREGYIPVYLDDNIVPPPSPLPFLRWPFLTSEIFD